MEVTEERLREETNKMLSVIKEKRKLLHLVDGNRKDVLSNLDAYISDTEHFIEKNDLIRAFEAVVYAWGILETLERTGIVKSG